MTGGPTRAYLDRVRFLSNISTGALALALCRKLCSHGIEVALVAGPTHQPFSKLPLARFVPVETTEEMHEAVLSLCRSFRPTHAVFTAAVLDFTPVHRRKGKVSSKLKTWTIRLKPTPKIIGEVARRFPMVKRVGFKLEWEPSGKNRKEKLARHLLEENGLDAVCINYLSEIQREENKHPAYLFSKEGEISRANSKAQIAAWISDFIRRQ